MEIHRLHEMLTNAGIEHDFIDRTPLILMDFGWEKTPNWGYQIIVYYPDGERMISAIEGFGSYGYGGQDHGLLGSDENDSDSIEIMGLLTPEEEKHDSVVGYLTADEVFQRIKDAMSRK